MNYARISLDILTTIIGAATEVFPKECVGTVYGIARNSHLEIETAFPYQAAERKRRKVDYGRSEKSDANKTIETISGTSNIGYFHSHTYQPHEKLEIGLSPEDMESFKEDGLEILLAIKRVEREQKQDFNISAKGRIVGSVKRYRINVSAYYWDLKKNRPRLVSLQCPQLNGNGR